MPRILVAEDDPSLLRLTAEILGQDAEVETTSDMAQALRALAERKYELLITDLNLEHPGGGLILAGANRALHPGSRNALMTGNADFAAALTALRSTLDQVLLKPVDTAALLELSRSAGAPESGRREAAAKTPLRQLLGLHRAAVVEDWMRLVLADPVLGQFSLNPQERVDHIDVVVEGLGQSRRRSEREHEAAVQHGQLRKSLGYRAEWLSLEIAYLRRACFDVILRELAELDLKRFPQELFELNLRLDADLLDSLTAFGLQ